MSNSKGTTAYVGALIRDRLSIALSNALSQAGIEGVSPGAVRIERVREAKFGDLASNVAMTVAKKHGLSSLALAQQLVSVLTSDLPAGVASVSVAGPGFINFKLETSWLYDVLKEVISRGDSYGRHQFGSGEKVLVEFVSANPTGDLHVGNGWWGSYGDALARLLSACGYEVVREYYVNDTGGQIRRLGESLLALKHGEPVPEDGYHGDYVAELAARYPVQTLSGACEAERAAAVTSAGRWAAQQILVSIKETLAKLGIEFDSWFSQASIEESGVVQETIDELSGKGLIYKQGEAGQEGAATFLRSTACGDARDRVLAKWDGDFTYFAGDLAYHRNKLLTRGFALAIDVFGADHHGHVPSLIAGVQALGIEKERLEVRLGQMVSLVEDGVEVQMSKRSGKFVTLSSLIDDIGPGAVRFLSLISSINQATTLDLKAARAKSAENPVHYVRYAYARIAQIRQRAQDRRIERLPLEQVKLDLLVHPSEYALLESLAELPDVVAQSCRERAPHMVTSWLRTLSGQFHSFYHDCYVLGEQVPCNLTQSRLWLIEAVRLGLTIALALLGVTAPERMFRDVAEEA